MNLAHESRGDNQLAARCSIMDREWRTRKVRARQTERLPFAESSKRTRLYRKLKRGFYYGAFAR